MQKLSYLIKTKYDIQAKNRQEYNWLKYYARFDLMFDINATFTRTIKSKINDYLYNIKITNYGDNNIKITRYKTSQMRDVLTTKKISYSSTVNVTKDYLIDLEIKEFLKENNLAYKNDQEIIKYILKTRSLLYGYLLTNQDDFKYFVTLTIEPNAVNDRTDNVEVTKKVSAWLRNHKRNYPDFNWLGVKEFHHKRFDNGRKALHFHIVTNGVGLPLIDTGYVKVKGIKKAIPYDVAIKKGFKTFQIVYSIKKYHYGWNSAIEIDDDKTSLFKYMLKYLSKDMVNNFNEFNHREKKILRSRNIKKPTVVYHYNSLQSFNMYVDILKETYRHTNTFTNVFVNSFSFEKRV